MPPRGPCPACRSCRVALRSRRFLHRFRCEHLVGQQPPGGQVRADHRLADAVEMSAQHARQLAHGTFGRQSFGHDLAQAHGRGELHQRAAAIEQDRQQPAEAPDQRPVFREQHREPAAGAIGRAADEDRHRHQLHVQRGIGTVRLQQPRQRTRMGAGLRRRLVLRQVLRHRQGADRIAPRQCHVRALASERVACQRPQWRWQSGLAAGAVEDQCVGQPVILEHVTDRAVVESVRGRLRFDRQLDPGVQHAPEQPRPPWSFGPQVVDVRGDRIGRRRDDLEFGLDRDLLVRCVLIRCVVVRRGVLPPGVGGLHACPLRHGFAAGQHRFDRRRPGVGARGVCVGHRGVRERQRSLGRHPRHYAQARRRPAEDPLRRTRPDMAGVDIQARRTAATTGSRRGASGSLPGRFVVPVCHRRFAWRR